MTHFLTAAVAAAILAAGAGATARAEAGAPATDVREVTVTALRTDRLLSFVISGEVDDKTYVSSAPIGINCGGPAFRYQPNPVRQCWVRVFNEKTVLLGATAPGKYGVDWTVAWTGCKPVNDGSMCEVVLTEDATAGATFKRGRP
jgi:hypothetical protein